MLTIVDYGLGNLRSIENMLRRAGIKSEITADAARIAEARRLILPGVGHFAFGMEQLHDRGLVEVLNERVLGSRVPVLGICLGAQLLGRHSEEGDAAGLGWIEMDTVAFDRSRLTHGEKVPHMGWADTHAKPHPLFAGLEEPRFYYVHSFHLRCDDPADVLCEAEHGYRFTSGVAKGNVMGVQFHPEKSHAFGVHVLKAFAMMSDGQTVV